MLGLRNKQEIIMKQSLSIRYTVLAALFAALTAVGGYIAIPIGPVPIVLANLFVLLAGLLLGSKWAVSSIAIYLFLGAIGLPVFAGGKSGVVVLLGPTGGFLLGYLACALIVALICGIGNPSLWKDIVAVSAGIAAVYLLGVPWLKFNSGLDWGKVFSIGMFPFIPGDILKGIAAVAAAKTLRPQMNE